MVTQARIMWLMAQIEYEKGSTNNIASIEAYQNEINQLLGNSGNPEAAAQEAKETTEAATGNFTRGKRTSEASSKRHYRGWRQ
ncbi:MAG: hypothetical protein ACLT1J_10260 [Mediterraneibacter gnavus]